MKTFSASIYSFFTFLFIFSSNLNAGHGVQGDATASVREGTNAVQPGAFEVSAGINSGHTNQSRSNPESYPAPISPKEAIHFIVSESVKCERYEAEVICYLPN